MAQAEGNHRMTPEAPSNTPNDLPGYVEHCWQLGWSFTPLNGKKPRLKGWQAAPRESLEQALAWAAAGNVGLRTGQASGVVAIDLDKGGNLEGMELPATVTVHTGGDGMHLYYRYSGPLGNSVGKLGPHIDVRADGGQVVFPGSVHPDTGKRYEWAPGGAPWEVELAPLPEHVLALLAVPDRRQPAAAPQTAPNAKPPGGTDSGPSKREKAANARADRYARRALQLELNAVYQAAEGKRNDTLNHAAFSLGQLVGGGCLDRGDVEELLREAGRAVGLTEDEVGGTMKSGLDAGMKEPRTVPDRPGTTAAYSPPSGAGSSAGSNGPVPTLPRCRFGLDLYGNADRFAHLFGQDVHWCQQRGQWYVWDGRCWKPDSMREAYRMAEMVMRALLAETADDKAGEEWATRCTKGYKAACEMLEVVKHRTAIALEALDAHPWLLGVQNGVVDLTTGKLLPHDRKYLITALCPGDYDAQAQCPRWLRFLGEIMPDNDPMIRALQRLAGYFLTADISVHILPIFHGLGANGKNVFLDTLIGLMGPYATEAPEGLVTVRQNDEHPTEIADLHGKRLVVASETEEGRKMRIGLVKKMTGNKFLKGRFMRQDFFQFERTHKTVLVTNNKPIVTEANNAIWRRLRLIPFTVIIPEERQDKHLTEKLVAEWPGILAWAVRGCLDWQSRKCDLELPAAVSAATNEYRGESDQVADFLAERCEDWRKFPGQKMRVPKERLYTAYIAWCHDVGEDALPRRDFNSRMRGRDFVDKDAKDSGSTLKCWLDLTLKGENHE